MNEDRTVGSARDWVFPKAVLLFWIAAIIALPIWIAHDTSAWDMRVYGAALRSLQAHHDPYLDATDIQKQHHAYLLAHPGVVYTGEPPWSYVYSPITLPLLRTLGLIPLGFLVPLYWLVYVAGVLAPIAVGVSFSRLKSERTVMLYVAGLAPFFPGLLANGTILGGNVAYILYGLVLATALLGWQKRSWWCFYIAVLLAACVKAPLLSLALIPALSAPKQWVKTCVTVAAGLALFACQPLIWKTLFAHYLEAVELQFSFNQDFGCSPAGLFSQALAHHGLPYSPASYFVYVGYALPVFATLVYFSRQYLRGAFPLRDWAPVLLCGIILLNPRIMEYDVAPITGMMALVCWRIAKATAKPALCVGLMLCAWLLMNAASIYSWEIRKDLDGPLLVAVLLGGLWTLRRTGRASAALTQVAAEPRGAHA